MAITIDYKPYKSEDIPQLQEKLKQFDRDLSVVTNFGCSMMLDETTLQHYYALALRIRKYADGKFKSLTFNATFQGRPLLFETHEDCKSVIGILREKRRSQIAAIKKMKKKVGVK